MCIPPVLRNLLRQYQGFFSKPQFRHFQHLVTGLVVSENKTLCEMNDCFSSRDQSNFNRFVTQSDFSLEKLNRLRLAQVKKHVQFANKGVLIVDESLLHKTGDYMELAGSHKSGMTKTLRWGHMLVNTIFSDESENTFPVDTQVFVREKDCPKYDRKFKTKRELGIEGIDVALQARLPVHTVIADAGYEGDTFVNAIKSRGLDFLVGVRTSTKISIDRRKRQEIGSIKDSLQEEDFCKITHNDKTYYYHMKKGFVKKIGAVKLIISYVEDDKDNTKCYLTNSQRPNENIMKLLLARWKIEVFHRDAKQHLGLEAYQVRKGRGMQVVALAILTAYTLVFLAKKWLLKTPFRCFQTIGETCRYLTIIAYKGTRWIKKKLNNLLEFKQMLNKHVLIKNAKV